MKSNRIKYLPLILILLMGCSSKQELSNKYNGKIMFVSSRINDQDIFTMDLDGDNQKKLYEADYFDRLFPFFSPNGNKIILKNTLEGNDNTFLVNVDGTELQKLGKLDIRKFLVDGDGFIITDSKNKTIKQTDLYGKNEKILFYTNKTAMNPETSKTGLLFSSKSEDQAELVFLNWDDLTPETISTCQSDFTFSFWGADIIFSCEDFENETQEIFWYDMKNKKLNALGKTEGYYPYFKVLSNNLSMINNDNNYILINKNKDVAWYVFDNMATLLIPEKNKLLFTVENYEKKTEQIYAINMDGTGQKQLTSLGTQNYNPVMTPDGKKILFISNRDGNKEIYSMNTDGSNQTNLTNNNSDDFHIVLQP